MDKALSAAVRLRAHRRCEYCGLPESESALSFTIDYVIARKHQGQTVLENLALACPSCNEHKGPNLTGIDPETMLLCRLFNPRSDEWGEHFRWDGVHLVGQTAVGRTTVAVLAMNDPAQLAFRLALLRSGWLLLPPNMQ